jgi:pimeloyl-ACP methyl ester carboxylesterase
MLDHIFRAMDGSYRGDARGNPFATLDRIRRPTRIATTERSSPIYAHMAALAKRLIPRATSHHFDDVGHSAAQERPQAVVAAARRFWSEAAG